MDKVRIDRQPPFEDDIEYEIINGITYIVPGTEGVSTLTSSGSGTGWWKFSEKEPNAVPIGLCIVNDKPNLWSWEPKSKITMDEYKMLLLSSHPLFVIIQ